MPRYRSYQDDQQAERLLISYIQELKGVGISDKDPV